MCGFGVVHPLPGILPGFQLDTAITLPVGVEAYGAYALGAWLAPDGVPAAFGCTRDSALDGAGYGRDALREHPRSRTRNRSRRRVQRSSWRTRSGLGGRTRSRPGARPPGRFERTQGTVPEVFTWAYP